MSGGLVSNFQTFVDPSLTAYEAETQKMMSAKEERPDIPESATQILDIIDTFKNADHHERLVTIEIYLFRAFNFQDCT